MTPHIEAKKEEIAKIVIMPGDPNRAKFIAENYLDDYRLVNSIRSNYIYTGHYKGKLVTIATSGMGMPSMGIYSYELFKDYDVNNIIRIGTMGAYTDLKLKDIVLVTNSITNSNYGRFLCGYNSVNIESNAELNNVIGSVANSLNIKVNKGNIYSSDVFYEQNNDFKDKVSKYSVLGVEMESFALFVNAKLLGKKASTLLMVSDSFLFENQLSSLEREQGLDNLILLALESCLKIEN